MTKSAKTFYELEVERFAKNHLLGEHLYVQIRQSKAFMDEYYSDPIDLETMASTACMSRFYFIRIFKQMYGITPRHYLRDVRMAKAKELLKSGLSVTEVCFDVGYESLPTFSSTFKQATGCSPKKYQKMNNGNLE